MPERDTRDAARVAQVLAWRRMGPERRLLIALRLSSDLRTIHLEGEQRRSTAALVRG
jgi:hypothetical protein